MVDSSAAQPNYQSNQRQTQTSLAKSRGGTSKSYVRVAGKEMVEVRKRGE